MKVAQFGLPTATDIHLGEASKDYRGRNTAMGIFSTDYTVTLTASDGTTAQLKLNIKTGHPTPGQDTWTGSVADFGIAGGAVSGWGTGDGLLTGPVGARSIVLTNFGRDTELDDDGTGDKNYSDGRFPQDSFRWRCTSKN